MNKFEYVEDGEIAETNNLQNNLNEQIIQINNNNNNNNNNIDNNNSISTSSSSSISSSSIVSNNNNLNSSSSGSNNNNNNNNNSWGNEKYDERRREPSIPNNNNNNNNNSNSNNINNNRNQDHGRNQQGHPLLLSNSLPHQHSHPRQQPPQYAPRQSIPPNNSSLMRGRGRGNGSINNNNNSNMNNNNNNNNNNAGNNGGRPILTGSLSEKRTIPVRGSTHPPRSMYSNQNQQSQSQSQSQQIGGSSLSNQNSSNDYSSGFSDYYRGSNYYGPNSSNSVSPPPPQSTISSSSQRFNQPRYPPPTSSSSSSSLINTNNSITPVGTEWSSQISSNSSVSSISGSVNKGLIGSNNRSSNLSNNNGSNNIMSPPLIKSNSSSSSSNVNITSSSSSSSSSSGNFTNNSNSNTNNSTNNNNTTTTVINSLVDLNTQPTSLPTKPKPQPLIHVVSDPNLTIDTPKINPPKSHNLTFPNKPQIQPRPPIIPHHHHHHHHLSNTTKVNITRLIDNVTSDSIILSQNSNSLINSVQDDLNLNTTNGTISNITSSSSSLPTSTIASSSSSSSSLLNLPPPPSLEGTESTGSVTSTGQSRNRVRLSWGQGLRRRASGPIDTDSQSQLASLSENSIKSETISSELEILQNQNSQTEKFKEIEDDIQQSQSREESDKLSESSQSINNNNNNNNKIDEVNQKNENNIISNSNNSGDGEIKESENSDDMILETKDNNENDKDNNNNIENNDIQNNNNNNNNNNGNNFDDDKVKDKNSGDENINDGNKITTDIIQDNSNKTIVENMNSNSTNSTNLTITLPGTIPSTSSSTITTTLESPRTKGKIGRPATTSAVSNSTSDDVKSSKKIEKKIKKNEKNPSGVLNRRKSFDEISPDSDSDGGNSNANANGNGSGNNKDNKNNKDYKDNNNNNNNNNQEEEGKKKRSSSRANLGDSDKESIEDEAPKKKRGRPPAGLIKQNSPSSPIADEEKEIIQQPQSLSKRGNRGGRGRGNGSTSTITNNSNNNNSGNNNGNNNNNNNRGSNSSKYDPTDLYQLLPPPPVKRRSRSFGSFERDSLGGLFSSVSDLRNAYYALQGMVRIQVGMRGVSGFNKEDLMGLNEMLKNPQSVVNLPIPYTSEIVMCLEIIEAKGYQLGDAMVTIQLLKREIEEIARKNPQFLQFNDSIGNLQDNNNNNNNIYSLPKITTSISEDLVTSTTNTDSCTITTPLHHKINTLPSNIGSFSYSSSPMGLVKKSTIKTEFNFQRQNNTNNNSVINTNNNNNIINNNVTNNNNINSTYYNHHQNSNINNISNNNFIINKSQGLKLWPEPQAFRFLTENLKKVSTAEVCAHVHFPPTISNAGNMYNIENLVRDGKEELIKKRSIIMNEVRRRKLARTEAWEILANRYLEVKHRWEHYDEHNINLQNEEEVFGPRLRAVSSMRNILGPRAPARLSTMRASSDISRPEIDQDKLLQQLAMKDLMARRLATGISNIPDMLSPWQNSDSSVPPKPPSWPPKDMYFPGINKQDIYICKSNEFPKYVVDSPVIIDINGCRLTTDGRRPLCAGQSPGQPCPINCNCVLQVDREERKFHPWSDMEKSIFLDKFMQFPKKFSKIAEFLVNRTTKDCIKFYYDSKTTIPYKSLLREFDNRKRHLRNSWTHSCSAAISVGGILYPPEGSDDKEHIAELPYDDVTYTTFCSHPMYMATALGYEGNDEEDKGTFRKKQMNYLQQRSPRNSTQLMSLRRELKRECLKLYGTSNNTACIPPYYGDIDNGGILRKFTYPNDIRKTNDNNNNNNNNNSISNNNSNNNNSNNNNNQSSNHSIKDGNNKNIGNNNGNNKMNNKNISNNSNNTGNNNNNNLNNKINNNNDMNNNINNNNNNDNMRNRKQKEEVGINSSKDYNLKDIDGSQSSGRGRGRGRRGRRPNTTGRCNGRGSSLDNINIDNTKLNHQHQHHHQVSMNSGVTDVINALATVSAQTNINSTSSSSINSINSTSINTNTSTSNNINHSITSSTVVNIQKTNILEQNNLIEKSNINKNNLNPINNPIVTNHSNNTNSNLTSTIANSTTNINNGVAIGIMNNLSRGRGRGRGRWNIRGGSSIGNSGNGNIGGIFMDNSKGRDLNDLNDDNIISGEIQQKEEYDENYDGEQNLENTIEELYEGEEEVVEEIEVIKHPEESIIQKETNEIIKPLDNIINESPSLSSSSSSSTTTTILLSNDIENNIDDKIIESENSTSMILETPVLTEEVHQVILSSSPSNLIQESNELSNNDINDQNDDKMEVVNRLIPSENVLEDKIQLNLIEKVEIEIKQKQKEIEEKQIEENYNPIQNNENENVVSSINEIINDIIVDIKEKETLNSNEKVNEEENKIRVVNDENQIKSDEIKNNLSLE